MSKDSEKLFEAMGNIDDEILKKTENRAGKNKKWFGGASLFACICLVAVALALTFRNNSNKTTNNIENSTKDVSPKFTEEYFPDGKIKKPTDIYYQLDDTSEKNVQQIYLWVTTPEAIERFYYECGIINVLNGWESEFDCVVDFTKIQIDCRIDDGDWLYRNSWDIDEYQMNLPYNMVLNSVVHYGYFVEGTYRIESPIINTSDSTEKCGFLEPIIVNDGQGGFLDLENHTISFRIRYVIKYHSYEKKEDIEYSFLYSDWSDEIKIGKEGNQEQNKKPEVVETPRISDLDPVVNEYSGELTGKWIIDTCFTDGNNKAQMYYSVYDFDFEPFTAVVRYRVKNNDDWGEWQEYHIPERNCIKGITMPFDTTDVKKKDTVEFCIYIKNNVYENLSSDYSDSFFWNEETQKHLENESDM